MFANMINNMTSGSRRCGYHWQSGTKKGLTRGYLLNDTFINYTNSPPYGIFPVIERSEYDPDDIYDPHDIFEWENNTIYYRQYYSESGRYGRFSIVPQITNGVITGYKMTKVEQNGNVDGDVTLISLFGSDFAHPSTGEITRRVMINNSLYLYLSSSSAVGASDTKNNVILGYDSSAQWDVYSPWDSGPKHETVSATFDNPRTLPVLCSDNNLRNFVFCDDVIIPGVRNAWYLSSFENWRLKHAVIPKSYISYIPV